MPFIPENIIDQIVNRVDIIEVISSYIPLKRAGRNLKALCPFHSEKTASFIVSPQRQIYHCFGCGQGGNVFSFLMQYEKLTFQEAAEMLARKAGVELPKTTATQQSKSIANVIYEINEIACKWYESNLTSAVKAKNYLEQRNLTEKTVKEFRLGFAPLGFNNLLNFLRTKDYTLQTLEKAGLVVQKAAGGYKDLFNNRLIFPIADIKDRIIGFGGRVLDSSLPKYINSPETTVYTKGRNLYGLNKAKEHIREKDYLIVVEGYLDLITLNQAGIGCVVSSLGTALTQEQAYLIKRFTNNVVMIFDSDKAGEMATLRTLDIFIQEDMQVKVAVLPKGYDPDLFVRKQGIKQFLDILGGALDLFNYKLSVLKSMFNLTEVYGKAKISEEMLNSISGFKNAVIKSEYVKRLAQELHIDEEALKVELKKIEVSNRKVTPANVKKSYTSNSDINATERLLVKLLLEQPERIDKIKQMVQPSDFQDKRFALVIKVLFDSVGKEQFVQPHRLINYFKDSEISSLIPQLLAEPEPIPEDSDNVIKDCIKRIKYRGYKKSLSILHEQIALAKDDPERLNGLLNEYDSLIKLEKMGKG